MMTFVTVQFDYGGNTIYARLLQVLIKSIKKNCPDAKVESIRVNPPRLHSFKRGMGSNTEKLKLWLEALNRIDDDNFIFIDCDTLVVRDISDVFEMDFDIACTERDNSPYKWNGGVVFVKKNERSIEFFKLWMEINNKMFFDRTFHEPWRKKYAGMNQAAFGYIREKKKYSAKIIDIPCKKWNCCNEDWSRPDPNVRIYHIKGSLRKSCLNLMRVPPHINKIVDLWRAYQDAPLSPDFHKGITTREIKSRMDLRITKIANASVI